MNIINVTSDLNVKIICKNLTSSLFPKNDKELKKHVG